MRVTEEAASVPRWRRWLYSVGDDPDEADQLEDLIAARVAETLSTSTEASREASQALERHRAFLRYRFGSHLRNYRRWGGKYAFAFVLLSVATVISGLASSGIAAGWSDATWARWTILALGLVAGVAAAINQIWRPGEKASSRMTGANRLCGEAWAYLERRGRYRPRRRPTDESEAFGLFVDEVLRIIQQAAAVDEATIEPPPLPASQP